MNKLKKKKEKGFTLIELLATIAILTLLMSIIAYISINVIDQSKEKSNKVTIETIKRTANMYSLEFKQTNDYWYPDTSNTEYEYACTTIQMLINKGYLKDNLVNAETGEKIEPNTFVKIIRNSKTKRNEDVIILDENDVDCNNLEDIEITISLSGENGENGYYKSKVNATISLSPENNVDEYWYYIVNGDVDGNKQEKTDGTSTVYEIDVQSSDLKICAYALNKNGKMDENHTCRELKIDLDDPSVPNVSNTSDFSKLLFSGSTDTLTRDDEIRYYYVDLNTENADPVEEKEFVVTGDSKIKVYTKDLAGRTSTSVEAVVSSATPTSGNVSKKYYCEYTGKYYSSQTEAADACVEEIVETYDGEVKYYCAGTGTYQTTALCKQYSTMEVNGTVAYFCEGEGLYQSSKTCTETYTGDVVYKCGDEYQSSSTCTSTYTGDVVYKCGDEYQSSSTCTSTYTGDVVYKCGDEYQSSSTCKETTSYTGTAVNVCPDGSTTTSNVCSSTLSTTRTYTIPCNKTTYSWSLDSSQSGGGWLSCSNTSSSCSSSSHVGNTYTSCSSSYYTCSLGSVSGSSCVIDGLSAAHCSTLTSNGFKCSYVNSGETYCTCSKSAEGPYYTKYVYTCNSSTASTGTYGDVTCTSNCSDQSCPAGYTKGTATSTGACGGYTGTCSSSASCTKTFTAPCTAVPTTKYSCNGILQSSSTCTSTSTYTGTKMYYCEETDTYQTSPTCQKTDTGTKMYYCEHNDTYQTSSTCQKTDTGTKMYYCDYDGTYQSTSTCTKSYTGEKYYLCANTGYQKESICKQTVESTEAGEVKYYCEETNTYQDSATCSSSTEVEHTLTNKYYCSLTNKYYSTQAAATNACTNSCGEGGIYVESTGQCYYLETNDSN